MFAGTRYLKPATSAAFLVLNPLALKSPSDRSSSFPTVTSIAELILPSRRDYANRGVSVFARVCYVVAVKHPSAALAALVASLACSPATYESSSSTSATPSARQVFQDQDGNTVAVLAGKTLYLSAIAPTDTQVEVEDQTRSAMEQLGESLQLASLDYSQVVSCHVHLSDMENYAGMNSVYGSFFQEGSYPARTTVEMPGLPNGAGVLLMCVAYSDPAEISVIRPSEEEIPPAMGPYSPAVKAGSRVYLSGQGGRDPASGEIAESAHGQVQQTLRTVGVILAAAGLGYDNAVQASSYFPPSSDPASVNEAFEAVFSPGGAPSHSNVPLSRLPGDIAVEITVVAAEDSYITRLFMHDQAPTGASSPVSLTGGVAYTSAMHGVGDTFQEQFLNAVEIQGTALRLASLDLPNVVRVVAYLSDLDNLPELRALLAETFPNNTPALAAVQARNPSGSMVSLEMIAVQ